MTQHEQAQKLNEAFDQTGVRFHDRPTALQALTADGREISYDDNGNPSVAYDGEVLPLKDALSRFAFDNRQHVDARTLPREGVGTARPGTLSKADFPTVADRVALIRERGIEFWENLPAQNHDTKPVETREDFYRLSRAEKVRRIAADPDILTKLPSAPRAASPVTQMEQVAPGTKVNRAGLEREKAIRGR